MSSEKDAGFRKGSLQGSGRVPERVPPKVFLQRLDNVPEHSCDFFNAGLKKRMKRFLVPLTEFLCGTCRRSPHPGQRSAQRRFAARPTPAQARSLARQAAGSPAASDGATLAWNPFKGSTGRACESIPGVAAKVSGTHPDRYS